MHAQAYRDDGWENYVEEILHTGKQEHKTERAEQPAPVAVGDVVLLAQVLDGLQLAHTRRHSDALLPAPVTMKAHQHNAREKDDEQHSEDDETSIRLCLPSPSPCGDTSPSVASVLHDADVRDYYDDYTSPVDASMTYGAGFGEPGGGGAGDDKSIPGTIVLEATQREGDDNHVHERGRSACHERDEVYDIQRITCCGGDERGEVGRRGEERRSRNDGQCRTLVDSPSLYRDAGLCEPGNAESVGTRAAVPPHKRPHLSLGSIVPATPDPPTPPYCPLLPPPPPPPPSSPPRHPPMPKPVQTASGTPTYGRTVCGGCGGDEGGTQTNTPEHMFTQTQVEPSTAMSVDRPATVHSTGRRSAERIMNEGPYNERGSPDPSPGSPHDRSVLRGLLFGPVFDATAAGHSHSPPHSGDHTQRDDGSSVCSNADMMSLSSVLGSAPTPSPDDIQAERDQRHLCEMMRMLVSPPAASPSSPMSLALSTDDTPTSLRRTNRRLTFHSPPPPPAPPRPSPPSAFNAAAAQAAAGTGIAASSSASHRRWPSLTPEGHGATMTTKVRGCYQTSDAGNGRRGDDPSLRRPFHSRTSSRHLSAFHPRTTHTHTLTHCHGHICRQSHPKPSHTPRHAANHAHHCR